MSLTTHNQLAGYTAQLQATGSSSMKPGGAARSDLHLIPENTNRSGRAAILLRKLSTTWAAIKRKLKFRQMRNGNHRNATSTVPQKQENASRNSLRQSPAAARIGRLGEAVEGTDMESLGRRDVQVLEDPLSTTTDAQLLTISPERSLRTASEDVVQSLGTFNFDETESGPEEGDARSAHNEANSSDHVGQQVTVTYSPAMRTSEQSQVYGRDLPHWTVGEVSATPRILSPPPHFRSESDSTSAQLLPASLRSVIFTNPNGMSSDQFGAPSISTEVSNDGDWTIDMQIHLPGILPPDHTAPRRGLLDTASAIHLVSQRVLDGLHLQPHLQRSPIIVTLGNHQVTPIGFIHILWHVLHHPAKQYLTKFWVVEENLEVSFDFLICSRWIKRNRALLRNPEVWRLGRLLDAD